MAAFSEAVVGLGSCAAVCSSVVASVSVSEALDDEVSAVSFALSGSTAYAGTDTLRVRTTIHKMPAAFLKALLTIIPPYILPMIHRLS